MDKCMTSSSTDVMYSRRSVVDKAVTSSLIRPKSALSSRSASRSTTARTVSSGLDRDIEDDDDVRSIASSISNNRQYHNNNGLDATDLKGRWGHLRSGATASTASSSRLHRMIPHHGTSTTYISSTRDRLVKTAPLATSRISRNSNNQQHARGSELTDRTSSKTESVRRPEGVSSTLAAATASSLRRQSGASKSTHTTLAALPDGWIRRIHSKNGREYYYDTNNKVASWKMPVKVSLDNMFCGLQILPRSHPLEVRPVYQFPHLLHRPVHKLQSHSRVEVRMGTSVGSKTGRLFYVNLVTNRSYAKLPSSVTAAMLNLGRQIITNRRVAAEAMHRKKPTIGHSPQFTQMSWQRKRVPATDE
ncbi:putative WW domain-containing protein [Plasmopara halstedii]